MNREREIRLFMRHVRKTDGCWLWTGKTKKPRNPERGRAGFGYGLLERNRREIRAHRFSYELFVEPIPAGLLVLHECDNPPCVRPDHLFVGTNGDNARDAVAKGRHTGAGWRFIFADGLMLSVAGWSRLKRISRETIQWRLLHGWNEARAVLTPPRSMRAATKGTT